MKEDIFYIIPIIITAVSAVAAIYSIITVRNKAKKQKEEAKHFLETNKSINSLLTTLSTSNEIKNEIVYHEISNINRDIKLLFESLTDSKCRSTIRVIVYNDNTPMIVSLASQSDSKKSKSSINFKQTKLHEDECISLFTQKHIDYYINNDIKEFNIHLPVKPKFGNENFWDDIYLSSLIVPIKKTERNINRDFIYGYMCIDSQKRNAFNKDIHVSFAQQITIGLLPLLERWTTRMLESNNSLVSTLNVTKAQ